MAMLCLTGASGFLGRRVAIDCSRAFSVRALSTHPIESPGVAESRVGDLSQSFLDQSLAGCAAIVHAAASTNTTDPNLLEVNVHYTSRLVRAARLNGVQSFIYISSENVAYDCGDPYTQSKRAAERIVLEAFPDALILRPSIMFGKGDERYLGVFAGAVRRWPVVPVFPEQHCTVQPIHVDDAAALVHRGLQLKTSGTFTIVGTTPLGFRQLGQQLARQLRTRPVFVTIPKSGVEIAIALLRLGPSSARRLALMLRNALCRRNTDVARIESTFDYRFPPFAERLLDLTT